MGDIADMVLEGVLCDCCGAYIDHEDNEPPGHPVTCEDCLLEDEEE